MKSSTRRLFNAYLQEMATANGQQFIANEQVQYTPNSHQLLFAALGESADFLQQINHVQVSAQVGQKIGLGIGRPIASRTNTDVEERKTSYVGTLNGDEYHCKQTNFDTHISYRLMDSWAHTGDFGAIYAGQIVKQIAHDLMMIGWNGKEAAETTDFEQNPLLQDVNVGWYEKVRQNAPAQIFPLDHEGNHDGQQHKVGEGGNYQTLDEMVFDMVNSLLEPWYRGSDDLVVMVGRELWLEHGLTLLAHSGKPTERSALQTWVANETVTGLPCIMPPFLPERGLIVTSYDNLSIYHQEDCFRRTPIDNPKRDRVEEYVSENQAFVVEDYGKFAAVAPESILLPSTDTDSGWK